MKPKAPKKKDPTPNCKTGEVKESWETDYFKNWYIGSDGLIWFRHKWIKIK